MSNAAEIKLAQDREVAAGRPHKKPAMLRFSFLYLPYTIYLVYEQALNVFGNRLLTPQLPGREYK